MLRNYLKTAVRNLVASPTFTLTSVVGLTAGMAVCIIATLYTQTELSYDAFHDHADRIVAIGSVANFQGELQRGLSTPYPAAEALVSNVPSVEAATRLADIEAFDAGQSPQTIIANGRGLYAEPSVFDVFSLRVLYGDAQTLLAQPNHLVLSQSKAMNIFGRDDVVGESVFWKTAEGMVLLTVAGVIYDVPETSSLPFDVLVSMATRPAEMRNSANWVESHMQTFARLDSEIAVAELTEQMVFMAQDFSQIGLSIRYFSLPLADLHLSGLSVTEGLTGTWFYIQVLGIIALVVLLIACINYVNLATARSARRSKEVGVRKTMGATRQQIAQQFLVESLLITTASFVLALAITELTLPFANGALGTALDISYGQHVGLFAALGSGMLLIGVAAGGYPAFYLSSLEPTRTLKGEKPERLHGVTLRRSLVVLQFTLSTTLIIGALIFYNQLDYVQTTDLGFEAENTIGWSLPEGMTAQRADLLRRQVSQHPQIQSVGLSSGIPSRFTSGVLRPNQSFSEETSRISDKPALWIPFSMDTHAVNALNFRLVAGTVPSHDASASGQYLLTEQAAQTMGWTSQEAVGKSFSINDAGTVAGVIQDVHVLSLHSESPNVAIHIPNAASLQPHWITARVNADGRERAIEHIRSTMAEASADSYVEEVFLEDTFQSMYRAEQQLGYLLGVIAIIAILLACTGLLGLAAHTAEQRTKEMAIRKTLGSTSTDIMMRLGYALITPVGIAFVLAIPLSIWAGSRFLQTFAYHAGIGASPIIVAAAATLILALATIARHTVRLTLSDPVDALKR